MTDEADKQQDARESINLKDPALAAFLAWLIPGLGHLYQGRFAKAALFFVCIMSTFVYGLYLGGSSELGWGRVVYASWRTNDKRLHYFAQIGIGLPAMPALVQASRMRSQKKVWGGDGFWKGFMAPPRLPRPGKDGDDFDRDVPDPDDPNRDQPAAHTLHNRLNRGFELGSVYATIAGLLNILAIYDAWGGPVFTETAKKEDEDEDGTSDKSGEKSDKQIDNKADRQ